MVEELWSLSCPANAQREVLVTAAEVLVGKREEPVAQHTEGVLAFLIGEVAALPVGDSHGGRSGQTEEDIPPLVTVL